MKPNFLIIGVQKGGTTSLYQYLLQHPQILAAATKEVHFFDLQWNQGTDWYLGQFPSGDLTHCLTGEASPYYIFHPLVARRVWDFDPTLKIIVLLRNPVDRALSHYHHEVRWEFESLDLESALAIEDERLAGELEKFQANPLYQSYAYQHHSYVARGRYVEQLKVWRSHFDAQQMMVLNSEKFYQNPVQTLDRVVQFLGLPGHEFSEFQKYNSGDYLQPSPEVYERLQARFLEANRQLRRYLQREFVTDWDVEFADQASWLNESILLD